MSYIREQFEYIPASDLLAHPRRWISGITGEFDEYVAHEITKVEEVDGIVYINYTMREGLQGFHRTREDFFRVTYVDFRGDTPSVEVELQVLPDKQVFVLKPEFEPERENVETEE